jgi:transposase
MAIGVGKRRSQLKDTTPAAYAARADNRLDHLVIAPGAYPAGNVMNKQIKAGRTKFFVIMIDRDVPATNNISDREICPSDICRKVTNCFRSDRRA